MLDKIKKIRSSPYLEGTIKLTRLPRPRRSLKKTKKLSPPRHRKLSIFEAVLSPEQEVIEDLIARVEELELANQALQAEVQRLRGDSTYINLGEVRFKGIIRCRRINRTQTQPVLPVMIK